MNINKYLLYCGILFIANCLLPIADCFAQDTIRIMQYNLLNYGNYTSYCNSSNNNISDKDNYLKTIINYVKPDIFTVNEMKADTLIIQHLMDNTLNIDGISYFQKADYTNYSDAYLVNMLYYNSSKFTLYSQDAIVTDVRDINIYKLYYNSPDLSSLNDTAFIICIVAHLKAGDTSLDETERANMTLALMEYLNSINVSDNYILMGDFNTYTSSEQAFQNLISYPNIKVRFHDPIYQTGNWNDNPSYALFHTQSTHKDQNGCPALGGMDDRFDFILLSYNVLYGDDKVKYIYNTYKALGQDGNYFDESIMSNPANDSVPANIVDALYNMSDHLPVIMDLKVEQTPASVENKTPKGDFYEFIKVNFSNPVDEQLNLYITANKTTDINISILSLTGQVLYENNFNNISEHFNCSISLENIKSGMYLLKITDKKSNRIIKKIFVCL